MVVQIHDDRQDNPFLTPFIEQRTGKVMIKQYQIPGKVISVNLEKKFGRSVMVAMIHLPRKYRFRRWLFKSVLALVAVHSECDIEFHDEVQSCA